MLDLDIPVIDLAQLLLGFDLLRGRTSYSQISRGLEAARMYIMTIVSLFNQASRQHCCRCACQITERVEESKHESRGFETSQDLVIRRPSVKLIESLISLMNSE